MGIRISISVDVIEPYVSPAPLVYVAISVSMISEGHADFKRMPFQVEEGRSWVASIIVTKVDNEILINGHDKNQMTEKD